MGKSIITEWRHVRGSKWMARELRKGYGPADVDMATTAVAANLRKVGDYQLTTNGGRPEGRSPKMENGRQRTRRCRRFHVTTGNWWV